MRYAAHKEHAELNYKDDLGGLADKYKKFALKIESAGLERDLDTELKSEVTRIQRRTNSGRDKNDQPFAPYSDNYKARKDNTGRVVRKNAKKRGDTVNLKMTGAMMSAVSSYIKREGSSLLLRVFVSGEEAKIALFHIKGDGVPRRDFLGFSQQFYKKVKNIVKKAFSNG